MEGLNQVILVGTVGNDPEVKQVGEKQTTLATFSLATNRTYKNGAGEKVQDTQWHTVETWNKMAEEFVAKWVKKGNNLLVIGEVRYDKYEDQEGKKRSFTKIYAKDIKFMPSANSNSNNQNNQQEATTNTVQQARTNATQYSNQSNQSAPSNDQNAVPIGPDAFDEVESVDDLPF